MEWSTQLSPGDARALRAWQLAKSGAGLVTVTTRNKTGERRGTWWWPRCPRSGGIGRLITRLGIDLHGEAYIFRNRSGAPYSSDTLGDDIRDVRHAACSEQERRTLADFRRSGAIEAIAGYAPPAALAHAMGNGQHLQRL